MFNALLRDTIIFDGIDMSYEQTSKVKDALKNISREEIPNIFFYDFDDVQKENYVFIVRTNINGLKSFEKQSIDLLNFKEKVYPNALFWEDPNSTDDWNQAKYFLNSFMGRPSSRHISYRKELKDHLELYIEIEKNEQQISTIGEDAYGKFWSVKYYDDYELFKKRFNEM